MRSILLLFLLSLSISSHSQSFSKVENEAAIKKLILEKTKSTKSIIGNFHETVYSSMYNHPKEADGIMHYVNPERLRWEHTKPVNKILIIDGEQIRFFENNEEVKNAGNNQIVKRVKSIMMQMFNGDFLSGKDFIIGYYENSQQYKIKLAPKSSRISKHMRYIELLFDRANLQLDQLTLYDTDQDKIVYSFSSVKFDTQIDYNVFTQF